MNALLNYPGGKWGLADRIIAMMPSHHSYLEPFFGSGAVFFSKPPAAIETINDLDGDVVNFFRILKICPEQLALEVAVTPYAREVYDTAWAEFGDDPLERAARFAIRSKMGFAYKRHTKTGFKLDIGGREAAYALREWNLLPQYIIEAAARLKNTQIENRPAVELIRKFNRPDVLIYADPPYLMDTRGGKQYNHEMSRQDHEELLHELLRSRASVILSGYASDLYDDALQSWNRIEFSARNQNKDARTEVVWMNFQPDDQQMSF